MEGSFAQAANCHGFKRARWRWLWRQQIQDWLIAACQNIKILIGKLPTQPIAGSSQAPTPPSGQSDRCSNAAGLLSARFTLFLRLQLRLARFSAERT
jgi:hypothetical protein